MTEISTDAPTLKRIHARRLREVYRSAGWPSLDIVEIELLAAGLLERQSRDGHDLVRVTDQGIQYLAQVAQNNRQVMSAHEALVDQVVKAMLRDGRLVWKNLSLRARVAPTDETTPGRWKMAMPDVFSIRNSSVQAYLEPIVHEIKVSRADLLGDVKRPDKRAAYLDLGGQCWYVLGCDRSGHPIAKANEIPLECGVMVYQGNQLEVMRMAPKRRATELPFGVWMALAKATPVRDLDLPGDGMSGQVGLVVDGDQVG